MQLDVKEVASHLDVKEKEVYHWINRNKIPCFRVNDRYRFNGAELLEWAAAHHMRLHPHILCGDSVLQVSVSDALTNGGIYYNIDHSDRELFLDRLMNLLPLPDNADRNFAREVIRRMPDLGLVNLGDGLLIPHVRHPLIAEVAAPALTLCFSAAGMPFNISENGSAAAVFFLVTPDVHTHQRIVSKLSFLLEDESLRSALFKQASPRDLLAVITRAEAELLS